MHYNFTTRKYLFAPMVLCALLLSSCGDDEETKPNNPYGEGNGRHTFWLGSDLGTGFIDVTVEGQNAGKITHFHTDGVDCGSGDVNVTKPAGTYTFTAKSSGGKNWAGTFTIADGQCNTTQLTTSNITQPAGHNLPSDYQNQGTITVNSQSVQICARDWDLVDGDIVTIIVNGQTLASEEEMTGTNMCWNATLDTGNNWIGVICNSPGTTTAASPRIEINDGTNTQGFSILSYPNQAGGYVLKVVL